MRSRQLSDPGRALEQLRMPASSPEDDAAARCAVLHLAAGHARNRDDLLLLCEALGLDPRLDRCDPPAGKES